MKNFLYFALSFLLLGCATQTSAQKRAKTIFEKNCDFWSKDESCERQASRAASKFQ